MKRGGAGERKAYASLSTSKLTALREATDGWVSSTDIKAMGLLGAGGTTLAIAGMQTTQDAVAYLPYVPRVFFGLFCFIGIMSCLSSVCCLWPRTDRRRALRQRGVAPLPSSPSVFWELGELDAESFQAIVVDVNDEALRRDALERAMIATWVATRKLYYLKLAIVLYMASVGSLIVAVLSSTMFV